MYCLTPEISLLLKPVLYQKPLKGIDILKIWWEELFERKMRGKMEMGRVREECVLLF